MLPAPACAPYSAAARVGVCAAASTVAASVRGRAGRRVRIRRLSSAPGQLIPDWVMAGNTRPSRFGVSHLTYNAPVPALFSTDAEAVPLRRQRVPSEARPERI